MTKHAEKLVVGEVVRLRGRAPWGTLVQIGVDTRWCVVKWAETPGPKIVHLDEVERWTPIHSAET